MTISKFLKDKKPLEYETYFETLEALIDLDEKELREIRRQSIKNKEPVFLKFMIDDLLAPTRKKLLVQRLQDWKNRK